MKVISLNIGEKREVLWRGKKVETGIFKYPVNQGIFLGKEDVTNDNVVDRRYHGGIDKACYLYGAEQYEYWKEKYPQVDLTYGAFGENITMQGLQENKILIGSIYQLGKAIVQVSQPRQPCFKQGIRFGTQKIVKDFFNSPFPGVYLRVLEPGEVHYQDEMQLLNAPAQGISVAEVHSLFTFNKKNIPLGTKAIEEVFLAGSYKKDLIKIFEKQ